MSSVAEELEKKSAIERLMDCRSPYIYLDGKTTSEAVNTDNTIERLKSLSKNDVHCMYKNNIFVLSDLQIAKFVAENIFATVPILKKAISHYFATAKTNEKIALSANLGTLKERLDDGLCRAQILYKNVFYNSSSKGQPKSKSSYYTCSPHGYNYLKRIVNFDKTYDEYTGVLAIDQVFKYLSTITVCQTFYESKNLINYEICNQEFTVNQKTGRKFYSPYGKVYLKGPDEERNIKYIIEPFFLSFNRFRISEKEYINDIYSRFQNAVNYLQMQMTKYDAKIVFACEDIKSITVAIELIKKYNATNLDNIYFTIDREADSAGISKSCLKYDGVNAIPVEIII